MNIQYIDIHIALYILVRNAWALLQATTISIPLTMCALRIRVCCCCIVAFAQQRGGEWVASNSGAANSLLHFCLFGGSVLGEFSSWLAPLGMWDVVPLDGITRTEPQINEWLAGWIDARRSVRQQRAFAMDRVRDTNGAIAATTLCGSRVVSSDSNR